MYNVFGSLTGHCKFDGRRVREIGEGSGFVEMYLFDGELIGRCGKETQLSRNCKFLIVLLKYAIFYFSSLLVRLGQIRLELWSF